MPSLVLPSNSFKQITNWLINKGALNAAPTFSNYALPVVNPYGMRSFVDASGALHTVMFGQANAYYLNPNGTFDLIGTVSVPVATQAWSMQVYQNKLFFSAGTQLLSYIQGDLSLHVAGDITFVQGGCQFLGKLDSKLLMINTFENQINFPRRVRWCAINNPLEWQASIDYTAGAVDISDVEDALTGWSTIAPYGYAYRSTGMSVFSPTGNGVNPFYIENYAIGDSGIGVFTPYTLDTFGVFSTFRAWNDIYRFDAGAAPSPIGGSAKRAILNDLDNNASSQPCARIIGALGPGYDYLAYWLAIPINNDTATSLWVYHFDDNTWINDQLPYQAIRSIAYLATS